MAGVDRIGRPDAWDAASGTERAIFRDRARRLGLPFVESVDLGPHPPVPAEAIRRGTFAISCGPDRTAYLAPEEEAVPLVRQWLDVHGNARRRLAVATPTAIRAGLRAAGDGAALAEAVDRLARRHPEFSARRTLTRGQGLLGAILAVILAGALVADAATTFLAVNFLATLFFFGVTALRLIAVRLAAPIVPFEPPDDVDDAELPVYTVLVPLHHEAHIVPQLRLALGRLDWPADRLDVKLIVEADDAAISAAVSRAFAGAPYEIVVVPPAGPRTKPKALAYAMTFARGDLVTIYDAEDLPHPQQLREAHATFAVSGPELGCLQAPLQIHVGEGRLLERLFSIEYAALFDGLLPALSVLGLPLPLGGTSNHFRREALERSGGWDPYNVTEDADLGMRLARFGYRSATITLATVEEAPATFGDWLRQRTRWFKGWMQTWLVHMRRPVLTYRELGPFGFLCFNLVGAGMLVSALVHPICLVTVAIVLVDPLSLWDKAGAIGSAVLGANLFNLAIGYFAVLLLTARALAFRGRQSEIPVLFGLPLYWLLMAPACIRALWQLAVRPHLWEKTPHVGMVGTAGTDGAPTEAERPPERRSAVAPTFARSA